MERNVSVIGGDLRIVYLIQMLVKDEFRVYTYGLEKAENLKNINNIFMCKNEEECIKKSKLIISSIPLCKEEEFINAPFSSRDILIKDVTKWLDGKVFIAGSIPKKLYNMQEEINFEIIDLIKCEELAILNSISTAEGAIQIAMEETEFTLHGSNILILGFGRIGKVLSKMLQGVGANVYCEARKNEDLAWIETYGYRKVPLSELDENLKDKDIIINTIPSMILDENRLKLIKKDSLIIDLASKPGGVDTKSAKDLGIKVIWLLALPGKVAPYSAAICIKQTIYNEIKNRNIF